MVKSDRCIRLDAYQFAGSSCCCTRYKVLYLLCCRKLRQLFLSYIM